MGEEQIKEIGTNLIGNYGWLFFVGFVAILFRSTLEGLVESVKIFWGNAINVGDVIYIWIEGKKYAGRIVRVGLFKCSIVVYNVSHKEGGEPYISGGEDLEIQNSKIKDYTMTRPMENIDISGFKKNGYKE
jgi:hypothetical protein|tara:strand:- start:1379 stop:1771 length:393 start_codon:yes stop_codon:yes gene_type:complete